MCHSACMQLVVLVCVVCVDAICVTLGLKSMTGWCKLTNDNEKNRWCQSQVTLSTRQVSVFKCSGQHMPVLRQSKCIANAIYYSLTINENIRIYQILLRTLPKIWEQYISILTACITQVTEFENSVEIHSFHL